jgi:hypothetical protein
MLLNELHLKKYKYIQLHIDFLLYLIKACAGLTGMGGEGRRGGCRFASPLCVQQWNLVPVWTGTTALKNRKTRLQYRDELIRLCNLINSLFLKLHKLLL